jgi:hypothetical protein
MLKENSKANSRKGKRYVEKISNAMWATLKHIVVSLEEEDFDLDLFWTPPESPSNPISKDLEDRNGWRDISCGKLLRM